MHAAIDTATRPRRLLPSKESHCLAVVARAAAPRKALSVSEWADAKRILSGKQAGERGNYRTSRTPFLREPMDCFSVDSPVQDVVVMKSSQVGVTEMILNVLGYTMEHAPAPAMVFLPTLESRDAWKAQKLNPMLLETPAIHDLLGGQRSRDASNRADLVDFPGGILFLAGGNSPQSYAQKSAKLVILDDLDRFPADVGDEGDPVTLARGRKKAFPRGKCGLISTPTVHEQSLIEREYNLSDKRRYFVPCPHCEEFQPLEWGGKDKPYGIRWNDDCSAAWYVCRHCAAEIYEHHKPAMLAAGRWIAEAPDVKTRGYHLTALLAPIGLGPSWLDLAQQWRVAVKSVATLRAFVNTELGEPWVEAGDEIEPTGLLARLEDYPDPLPLLAKTCGIDVQKDRIEASIVGWQDGEESFLLDHLIIPGDTARPEVWAELGDVLADHKPEAVGIDSGYNTSMVYAFCERRAYTFALKGMDGPGRPIVEDERARRQRLRRQRKKGIMVHMVGTDQAKALIYARLKLTEPGPGYVHFPNNATFDDEYFAQLTAEKLTTKMRGTRPIATWVQTRPRNETLDCKIYALAALRLSGINLKARAESAKAAAAAEPKPQTQQVTRPGFVKGWKR